MKNCTFSRISSHYKSMQCISKHQDGKFYSDCIVMRFLRSLFGLHYFPFLLQAKLHQAKIGLRHRVTSFYIDIKVGFFSMKINQVIFHCKLLLYFSWAYKALDISSRLQYFAQVYYYTEKYQNRLKVVSLDFRTFYTTYLPIFKAQMPEP